MKKQIVVTLVTFVVSGIVIASIVPLLKPAGAGSDVAASLVVKLFPLGLAATLVAFFWSKPRGDGQTE